MATVPAPPTPVLALPDHLQLPDKTDDIPPPLPVQTLPDHLQLPDKDGEIVTNFGELPQTILLSTSIEPQLHKLHPDGQYCIGQNSGIYFRLTDPALQGCKAPDWFYVPNVPPTLHGEVRRSYVLWQEIISPLLVLEYASGNGSEERDQTPLTGKFWVYEQGIRVPYYGIYEPFRGLLGVFQLAGGKYAPMAPNERGHFPIPDMGVELGLWQGRFMNVEMLWLRWWDAQGNLLPTAPELAEQERQRAEQERQRAEQERQRAEQERQRAEHLAERLRALGVDPDAV